MPLPSSETSPTSRPLANGPVLECAPPGADPADQTLRIRARRLYPVSRQELFDAWTGCSAWDSWMRLRDRSRTTLAPYRGGAFRLELAEGATIHVISGTMIDILPPESLSLSWAHHGMTQQASTIDLTFRDRASRTELLVAHGKIASRREAAWLMRLWATVLDRLASYVADGSTNAAGRDRAAPIAPSHAPELHRPGARTAFRRMRIDVCKLRTASQSGSSLPRSQSEAHHLDHDPAARP